MKKKPKKKVAKKKTTKKKVVKRKPKQPTTRVEITIKQEKPTTTALATTKDLEPEKYKGKYMLVPGALTEPQVLHMLQKTPPQHIYTRPGPGGMKLDYVTGTYMKKVLNFVFGWMWSFDVLDTAEKYGQVIVRGKLTIHNKKGEVIIWKSDTGKATIKLKDKKPMDYGNDEKAAITDCIKRCASQFGFASDVYGKSEFKEIEVPLQETKVEPDKEEKLEDQVECQNNCGAVVSKQVAKYSKTNFKGKVYCGDCQKGKK